MNIVAKILIVIAIIIAIPLVLALFIDNQYAVERDIVIDKPNDEVFEYITHLRNQENYNKWSMMDPGMKEEFSGTDGTVGFVYAWDSEEAGKGEQEIMEINEGKRIDLELRFIKPFEGIAHTHMLTEPISENQTKVVWGMEGESKYPMNFMNLFMDNMLGNDLELSLTNLKGVLESS